MQLKMLWMQPLKLKKSFKVSVYSFDRVISLMSVIVFVAPVKM